MKTGTGLAVYRGMKTRKVINHPSSTRGYLTEEELEQAIELGIAYWDHSFDWGEFDVTLAPANEEQAQFLRELDLY